ncbi:MAG: hypothetical protein IH988_02310, partial [Planctomycetes bacterium]|nr:hypothetical protein [Planctomycetota bacterium]
MNVRWCRQTLLSFCIGGVGIVLADELTFTAYDIGDLGCPEVTVAVAYDINDSGVIVGLSAAPPCRPIDGHGFAWFNGVMTDLTATSEGAPFNSVNGISRDGTVIATGAGIELVVFVRDGVGVEIGPPPDWERNSYARGINQSGTMIVGSCSIKTIDAPAVYWTDDGSALALDLIPGAPGDGQGEGRDVNDNGVVVGYNSFGTEGPRGFIWADGVTTELVNTLGPGWLSADAISNSGFISGVVDTPDGFQAMRYDMNTGEMIALGPGVAKDVNDRGD